MRGEVEFLKERQRFGDSKNSAPFDSAVIVSRKAKEGTVPYETQQIHPDRRGALTSR
jgi:hypothetical protein